MLLTPGNHFNAQATNYSTYTEAGFGASLTAGGTNHTKNATITSILSALADDAYGITIGFSAGFSAGASRRYLVDIYIDPAGGTSWAASPIIANLAANSVSLTQGGVWYFFPLFIPAGASIGATCQAETASATIRIGVKVLMKPTRLELWPHGRKTLTIGASTATTVGTAITPGTSGAKGSYADLGTIAEDLFWYQLGFLINDSTQTAVQYWSDIAVGDANSKYLALEDIVHLNIGTGEVAGRPSTMGAYPPYRWTKNGDNIYVRAANLGGTNDSNISAIAYGVVP